jgi:hypothetical protein
MITQQDIDKLKQWIVDNIIFEVEDETKSLSEEKAKDLVESQSVRNSYQSYHTLSGLERGHITIRMNRGTISGDQKISVPSHTRTSKKGKVYSVGGYDRTYVDKRLFRLPNGQITVLDYIPTSIAQEILTDAFFEALSSRAEYFYNK